MTQVNSEGIKKIFKTVYGGEFTLTPGNDVVDELFPYEASKQTGQDFAEDFIMGDEVGCTWAGQAQKAFQIKPAIAGAIEQSKIVGSQFVLASVLAWGFMSRSASGGEQSFFQGTKLVMKNHLSSHFKLRAIEKIYGQSALGLGSVSFAPSGTIYRGIGYTAAGNISLTKKDGTAVPFTAGVNAAQKTILFAPGQFAAGFFVGKKGIVLKQIERATGLVVAQGKLVSTDARLGFVTVDFVPVSATAVDSHYITFDEWENNGCMVGAERIIRNTGTLFGINAAQHDLWSGQVLDVGDRKFNLKAVQSAIADAINAGGLEESMDILVNPVTFAQMSNDEAAMRNLDASYKSATATNGFEAIEYYAANGTNRIRASSKIKEGHAFGFVKDHWKCSGSQKPSFRTNGIEQEVIFPMEQQAGWTVRSFSDMYLLSRMPARQIMWIGINPEGVAF